MGARVVVGAACTRGAAACALRRATVTLTTAAGTVCLTIIAAQGQRACEAGESNKGSEMGMGQIAQHSHVAMMPKEARLARGGSSQRE